MPPTKKLDLNVEVDVLTAGSTADVVNAILEFLLYQRNQIPFVYNTYKYYVGLWSEDGKSSVNGPSADTQVNPLHAFQMDRQREQAQQTKDAISAMRELIQKSFERNIVRSLRFIFGSTTFTAKEAYTIHIPLDAISPLHYHNQHRIPHARLNQTLISLLTSEDLYSIFSHNLSPTNLYLELEMICKPHNLHNSYKNSQLLAKDVCPLPPSCKDIHIYLQHRPLPVIVDDLTLNCCKELEVFGGIMCRNGVDANNSSSQLNCEEKNLSSPTWWESDILVRGFKEKPMKGLSIWTK